MDTHIEDLCFPKNEQNNHSPVVPDIVSSLPPEFIYKSVTSRYFTRRYCIDVKNIVKNDHLLLFHSNRICLVTLAPSHPIFTEEGDFTIDFRIGNIDRAKNYVRGKGKKGGQSLDKNSVLCKIQCKSGNEYSISSCINGKLIEINENLLTNPSLLRSYPDSDGYIAIILSNIAESDSRKEELLSEAEYFACRDTL